MQFFICNKFADFPSLEVCLFLKLFNSSKKPKLVYALGRRPHVGNLSLSLALSHTASKTSAARLVLPLPSPGTCIGFGVWLRVELLLHHSVVVYVVVYCI